MSSSPLMMPTHALPFPELAFWLYLLHQRPQKAEWFESWEYRMWYMGKSFLLLPYL